MRSDDERKTSGLTRCFLTRGLLLTAMCLTGCVRQQLMIRTTPPGANVYYNGRLLGASPVTYDFLWYEPYRVRVEKEGQIPLQENGVLKAPVWMWFPLDGIMAVLPLPLKDRHYINFDFTNPKPQHIAAAQEPPSETTQPTHTGVLDDLRRIHQKR